MRPPPTAGRLACLVPLCRRTTPAARHPGATEWLCGPHWRLVGATLRAGKVAAARRERSARRAGIEVRCEAGEGPCDCATCAWERCVEAAVGEATGIGLVEVRGLFGPGMRGTDHG